MQSKRTLLLVTVLIVALAAGTTAWLLWPRGSEAEPPKAVTSSPHAPDYKEDLKDLERILNKPGTSLQEQSLAFASFLRESYVKAGQPALPDGITITFQPDTFKLQAGYDSKATVDARLSNGQVHTAYLVKENGHWYIATTAAR